MFDRSIVHVFDQENTLPVKLKKFQKIEVVLVYLKKQVLRIERHVWYKLCDSSLQ
jgi:hypothetical protein